MATGIVKWFNDSKGFGFITPDEGGIDLFFHANNLVEVDFEELQEGDKVEFEIVDTPKGKAAEGIRKA